MKHSIVPGHDEAPSRRMILFLQSTSKRRFLYMRLVSSGKGNQIRSEREHRILLEGAKRSDKEIE